MFQWLRQSNQVERRTFWACLSGWSLDSLDVNMFSLVIPALVASWHVSHAEAGLVSSVTLGGSALGGWLGGALADRTGRVRALQITVFWFATATFASAFAQSFNQLLVFKGLQGLGFGAEWTAGVVLMAEVIRPEHRGRALGAVQSGWPIGWGASVLLYSATFSLFPPDVEHGASCSPLGYFRHCWSFISVAACQSQHEFLPCLRSRVLATRFSASSSPQHFGSPWSAFCSASVLMADTKHCSHGFRPFSKQSVISPLWARAATSV